MLSKSRVAHSDRICSLISVHRSPYACSLSFVLACLFTLSDDMPFIVCGALQSRDPVE